jgi:lipopolysaccharide biosynthesis protein
VRRREYAKLDRRYRAMVDALGADLPRADQARITVLDGVAARPGPELALFVSYAPQPQLKRHVVRHVEALLDAGLQIVLIINTPLAPDAIEIDGGLRARLAGVFVRENAGFDFGAWAHVFGLLRESLAGCERLLLTNDSIVGPLRAGQLAAVLERVRSSPADVIGLTEYHAPRQHLQSFFLVFQHRALQGNTLGRFMHEVRNLPDKELVIDLYETVLTRRLLSAGLRCDALFPSMAGSAFESNDTSERWQELVDKGFPYVKTSVLEKHWGTPRMIRLVPAEIRDAYEFANREPAR